MKRLLSFFMATLILTLSLISLSSCFESDDTQIKIGYMAGPTGMGMAKLIHDNGGVENADGKYFFKKFTDTSLATAALTNGDVDMVCLPTNDAAKYYNTVDDGTVVLAINCYSSLYVAVKNGVDYSSFSDLEGKTIYTCKNGTPKLVLEYLLAETGVNATVSYEFEGKTITAPSDIPSIIGKVDFALVPEPVLTQALISKNADYRSYNLGNVWSENLTSPLVMGCIVANKDFVDAHKGLTDKFLDEYKASIEFVDSAANINEAAAYVVETGVMGAENPAKRALNNLRGAIAYLDGADMKAALEAFYNAIGTAPIGGKLPESNFYYEK